MKRSLLVVFSILLFLFLGSALYAFPEGQLYWVMDEYPDSYFLHNTTDDYNGAENAIDYACTQSPGTGTYTGDVRILASSINFPAEKAGYCQLTRPLIPVTFDGNLYYAYLYCNGEKREDLFDDSACEVPTSPFNNDQNQGPTCPDE